MKKEAFFKASHLRQAAVTVDGVGEVMLRELTAAQHDEILKLQNEKTGAIDFLCHLIVMSARDGNEAMFTAEDLPQLRELSLSSLKKISDKVLELSGMDEKKADSLPDESLSTS